MYNNKKRRKIVGEIISIKLVEIKQIMLALLIGNYSMSSAGSCATTINFISYLKTLQ